MRTSNTHKVDLGPHPALIVTTFAALVAFVTACGSAKAQNPPPNSPVKVLFSFFSEADSSQPIGMIKARTGLFYGTTIGGEVDLGSVFSISEDGTFATLHFFHGADGDFPYGRLVEGHNGTLYGTTIYGGTNNRGVVFRITSEGVFTILRDFGSDPSIGTYPWGGLVQGSDGNFYGTTFDGGLNGVGTIYRMTPEGEITTLYNFPANGGRPNGQTLTSGRNGFLYGETCNLQAGSGEYETIFRLSLAGKVETIFRFPSRTSGTGYCPVAPLLEAHDGDFYGTTQFGGTHNAGTVFRVNPGGRVTFLHNFEPPCQTQGCTNEGYYPTNELVEAPDGFFYSTIAGCNVGGDCVYRINRSGDFTSNIYDFTSPEAMSAGDLIPGDNDGLYYSFAQGGGMIEHRSDGDIFSIDLQLLSRGLGQGWHLEKR